MKTAFPAIAFLLAGCATTNATPAPGAALSRRRHRALLGRGHRRRADRLRSARPARRGSWRRPAPRRSPTAIATSRPPFASTSPMYRCNDGMGDRYYADTFQVYFPGGDRPLEGCGGGDPAARQPQRYRLGDRRDRRRGNRAGRRLRRSQFDDGRLSGQAGCNRFSGSYAEAGGTLTPRPDHGRPAWPARSPRMSARAQDAEAARRPRPHLPIRTATPCC